MPTETYQRKLLSPLIISVLLHLGALKALEFLPKDLLKQEIQPPIKKTKPIEVRSISRRDLKKYRTVGVKNGKKNFSVPLKQKGDAGIAKKTAAPKAIKVRTKVTPKPIKKTKTITKKAAPKKSDLSLNALRVKTPAKTSPLLNTKMRKLEEEDKSKKLEITTNKQVQYQRTKEAQTDVLKQLAASPDNATVLRKTGFNMQLEPPEGVSEDELNSMEKIFYSFQKRTFRSYVGSFLKTYRQILLERPSVKGTLQTEPHRLSARVIFDSSGNIVSIKILRSSHNDDIHDLFETTLRDIRKLPNPPKDLLSKDGEFTIYYQLKIN